MNKDLKSYSEEELRTEIFYRELARNKQYTVKSDLTFLLDLNIEGDRTLVIEYNNNCIRLSKVDILALRCLLAIIED